MPSRLHMLRLSGAAHSSPLSSPAPAPGRRGLPRSPTEPRRGGRAAMKRSRRRLSAASRRRPRRSHCHRLVRRKWSCAGPGGCREGLAKGRAAGEPQRGSSLGRGRNHDPCGPPSRKWTREEESNQGCWG